MNKKKSLSVKRILARILLVICTTLCILLIALYGIMWILINGPSKRAKELFVISARETSGIKWCPNIYLSENEIQQIINSNKVVYSDEDTDTSLININAGGNNSNTDNEPAEDDTEDSDIEIKDVTGPTYRGKMMIIKDPSRVFVGVKGDFDGSVGKRVDQIVERYGAVAGVNGGEFADEGGMSHGEYPVGLVISEGKLLYGSENTVYPLVVGIDKNNILRLDAMSGKQALEEGIRDCVCFGAGPIFVKNGEPSEVLGSSSGLNPRTAIGQRADGAILLLVIDGRQASSLGASYEDVINIMVQYEAVNAANLDGGTSSNMVYKGEVITNCSSLYGTRQLPTAVLVR